MSHYKSLKVIGAMVAVFISGIMAYAAFPSSDLSFLAWFALVPLFLVLSRSNAVGGFLIFALWGVIFYSGLFYWMFDLPGYRGLHHAVLGVYLCPLLGLAGLLFCFTAKRSGIGPALFVIPFIWVIQEYIRSNLGFLSLPWGLLGHTQYQHPMLIQGAGIAGVYGLSFLIVLVNAGITALLYPWLFSQKKNRSAADIGLSQRSKLALVCCTIIALSANIIYGYVITSRPIEGRSIRLSLIQGNIEQARKWDKEFASTIMQIYSDLTLKASKDSPDLIVWPESATPKGVHRDPKIFSRIKSLAAKTEIPILLGSSQLAKFKVTKPRKKAEYLNSAFLITPDPGERLQQKYDKIRLLPFSEYLPHKDKISWSLLNIPDTGNFRQGTKFTIFDLPESRFAVTICWENIFPDIVRMFVKNGAQFIVNISNEAWFGKSAAPYQFLSMNVFRAVENGRFVVRCANTGISCFIDPTGRIISKLEDTGGHDIFVSGYLTGAVIPLKKQTIYNRYGDWIVWVGVVYSLLSVLIAIFTRKRRIA